MDNDKLVSNSNLLIENNDNNNFNENTFIGVKNNEPIEKQNKIGNIHILLRYNSNPIISIGPDCKLLFIIISSHDIYSLWYLY